MERADKRKEPADPVASSESLTASTESESFETWTLVTEGRKQRPTKASLETENALDEEDRVELIERDDNNKRDNENPDDLSDGISIISDNESAGRSSPNLLLGDSSGERHFPLLPEISSDFDGCSKGIKYEPLTPPASPREIEIRYKVDTQIIDKRRTEQERPSPPEQSAPAIFGVGARGALLATIIIALAAFIAKMRYPEFEQLSLSSTITPLTERIEDLELQNNLLRAEIDLLNKQVKYLTEQRLKPGQKGESRDPYRQEEAKHRGGPKIWSGAGDLESEETFGKEYGGKPRNVPPPPINIDRQYKDKNSNLRKDVNSKEFSEQRPGKDERKYDKDRKPHENPKYHGEAYPTNGQKYDQKYPKHDTGKNVDRENWKKDKRDYNSKEHFETDSQEQLRRERRRQWSGQDRSREQYHNKGNKNWKDEEDWHEKMMQHREEARKKQNQHDSNNWYIERGNGREEARVIEK